MEKEPSWFVVPNVVWNSKREAESSATLFLLPLKIGFDSSYQPGFYPYNDKSVLIKTPVKCHPCGIHHCDTLECMKTIGVDVVLEQVLTMLDKYKMSTGAVPRNIGQYQCEIIELH